MYRTSRGTARRHRSIAMNLLRSRLLATIVGSVACSALLYACGGGGGYGGGNGGMAGQGYAATSLVSDAATIYSSTHTDPNLVNGWGVAMNPAGFAWVADEGSSKASLYDGNGVQQAPLVSIPAGRAGPALPTGIVHNGSATEFMIGAPGARAPALFIFAGLGGTIAGWSQAVDASNALTMVDNAAAGSVYTGLALAAQGGAGFLYAADFFNGRVDVFDSSFAPATAAGGFKDPSLPAGYAPFGIQAIGDRIYVAYAIPDPTTHEKRGAGLGVLDVFDTSGTLIKQLVAAGGVLDAPWGIAMTPADFGQFSNALLVGNFGDGRINAFDPNTGARLGTLADGNGTPLAFDGLWGIAFGNGINALPTNTLFYAAGPGNETHGVFGRIDVR
jgi:uncharacterized protein (TIGR03118 family)